MGRVLAHYGHMIAGRPELGPILAPALVARVEAAVAEPLAESRVAIESLKAAKASTRRALYQKLERARDHLHACDSRAVPLAELAQVAGLSQFHLARYFRLAFGQSPIAYHRALRLERAVAALEQGASVSSVAEAAGYSDATALSHAFRRRFGRPPQHWMSRVKGA
ncbi:AraC family transcriptional regulator [Sphingomonas sp. LY54]|uniref:AraC family transcriptional regulator n=1 Tax=Sphingomonas sp. LY54 TaxID=3095343 RepID=UPI002D791D20|nr:AraC family transcriptional regulator [Sphingomonas sp. LY54]WRP29249.1 AraC family transcriptional regulator [Sphingomonas sp. LY54]